MEDEPEVEFTDDDLIDDLTMEEAMEACHENGLAADRGAPFF